MCKFSSPLSLFSPFLSSLSLLPSVQEAVANINQAIQSGSLGSLLRSLQTEDARLNNVVPENMQWYMDVLSKAMKDKAEVCAFIAPSTFNPNLIQSDSFSVVSYTCM